MKNITFQNFYGERFAPTWPLPKAQPGARSVQRRQPDVHQPGKSRSGLTPGLKLIRPAD